MRLFLEELGNPHQAYKSFHVAGTKGKGSTAAFLASILEAAGYRTGLYTSPHVSDPAERVAVFDSSGVNLPDEHVLKELVREVAQFVESLPQRSQLWDFPVSMFELLTLFAMLYFREAGCRYVVLETGIGGRYDATNVVKPLASVLTPVDFDHTEILGETLE
ncbi:MAG: bifunctional folylpolyglutamate synthase/dihydrofolate synthase, partial [bacterium]|nr:bifunctional folylpolyglutamate synthase/dihydrofolate synthase [bacterium]